MDINNRRYTGSKYKLAKWIKNKVLATCPEATSFFDVFGGTGVITAEFLDSFDEFYLNDFLYSNEVIYRAFFEQKKYSHSRVCSIRDYYQSLDAAMLKENFISLNYGQKYFSQNDALTIGFIRQDIEDRLLNKSINKKEYYILLASLLYSFDKIANTVGHYEAFIQGNTISDKFSYELITPIVTNKKISIFREDSNNLCKRISCDIAFVDPPYNSRQYSRFYHVMETVVKWDAPELRGVAMKPPEENMSNYSRNSAPIVFADLIQNLDAKYIVVTYNNTYASKSSSSQNKISHEQIIGILNQKGQVQTYYRKHSAFNAGKTDLNNHREYLFICTTR